MIKLPSLGDEVSVWMDAPPAEVWDLVSDVTRIGEFSPETFEAEWTRGATGPEKGATFRGHVKRNGVGPVYWTPCKVTACEPEVLFEFAVMLRGPANNWGYRLTPKDGGTLVTEYFRLAPVPVSSSLVRERVLHGESIDELVPPKVADAITRLGLYGSAE